MKKVLLTFVVALFATFLSAQPVERQMVVVEIGTGTWCQYCPGAAVGADDLIAAGCDVAVIKNQNGDAYANVYSNARNSYNGVPGYPHATFDGIEENGGGSTCPNPTGKYDDYRPIYDQRIALSSNYTVDIYGNQNGTSFEVEVHVTQVADYASDDIVLQFFITESHIAESWQGCMTELNHVNRKMVPNQNGTPVSMSNGDTEIFNLSFDIDDTWVVDNLEFVAALQDNNTKEMLQAMMIEVPHLTPPQVMAAFTADKTQICVGETVNFTDQTIGNPNSWNWSFQGGTPNSSSDQNPSIQYDVAGSYNVQLTAANPSSSNSVMKPGYIKVMTTPNRPPKPTGDAALCQGSEAEFTTNGVSSATSYVWQVTPEEAGTIEGSGKTIVFVPSYDYTGEVEISVQAVNLCGQSDFSIPVSADISPVPVQAAMPDGESEFCEGTATTDYTTTEIEGATGYSWVLIPRNAGTIVANGTSATVNWADGFGGDAEIYVSAENDCGFGQPSDHLMVSVMGIPVTPSTPEGPEDVYTSETPTTEFTTESEFAQTYEWTVTPIEAGTVQGNEATVVVEWNIDYEGDINIAAKGMNDCGESEFSESFTCHVQFSVGVEELNALKVQLMPNPSNGQFEINLAAGYKDAMNIRIVDITGAVVYEELNVNFTGNYNKTMDLQQLDNGIYFLIIDGEKTQLKEKLILQ